MDEPIRLTDQSQLLLDGHVIEYLDGMTRRVCPVRKHDANPLLRPSAAWEPPGYILRGSVVRSQGAATWMAWASAAGNPSTRPPQTPPACPGAVHLFYSDDGIVWRRPELDALEIAGQRTNIVALPQRAEHPLSLPAMYEFFGAGPDPEDPDPERRYKMGYLYMLTGDHGRRMDPYHPGQHRGLGVAFSPDGIHWRAEPEAVTQATCDGFTYWMRDVKRGRWVLFGRTKHVTPAVRAKYGEARFFQRHHWGRAVRRAESEDFVHWEPDGGEWVLSIDTDDPPTAEIYSMNVFPWGELYIGLVQVFYNDADAARLEIQLATSRDGIHFQRLSDRDPFIPVGGVGEWDRFNQSSVQGPPVRVGDELRFYYGGRLCRHGGAYAGSDDGRGMVDLVASGGLGTIPVDRFAALEAGFDAGQLVTRPLRLEGGQLRVNAAVPFGRLQVRLLDLAMHPLAPPEAVLAGVDGLDLPVPLPHLGSRGEEPVRLQFTLRNGKLFGFRATAPGT